MSELPPPSGMATLDWVVVAAYLVLAFGAGVLLARRSRGSTEDFFLSGRRLPWWLAGTSMVATSFAADTPLVVTGWTRAGGIGGNWRWWAYLVGAVLGVVVFSRLWRRSAVFTDVEFMEVRYSGGSARFLRAFKGVYQVVFLHCFIMGWVILAMKKVLGVLFDFGDDVLYAWGPWEFTAPWLVMFGCAVVALLYSEIAGLWGVVLTDFIQFGLALVGAIALMVWVTDAFGGVGAMVSALSQAPELASKLTYGTPVAAADPGSWGREGWEFMVFVCVMWFANKNADGSGVMVQRILASRDERHSMLATLWYVVAHYAIRPWPWIIVALASLLVLPSVALNTPVDGTVVEVAAEVVVVAPAGGGAPVRLDVPATGLDDWRVHSLVKVGDEVLAGKAVASTDDEAAYPIMMRRFLPAGLLGLLVASQLAAFMSTMDTHVNLASAYLVNDVYRRFVVKQAPERHYLRVARASGVLVLGLALVFAHFSDSVREMFDWFSALYSGLGVVYVLRWFWWRVNAWSEITALVTSGLTTLALKLHPEWFGPWLPAELVDAGQPVFAGMLLVVLCTTLPAVLVMTLATPPVDAERLAAFFARVRPLGAWGPVAKPAGWRPAPALVWARIVVAWWAGLALVLGCLFLPATLLFDGGADAWGWGLCLIGGGIVMWLAMPSLGAVTPAAEPPNLD